MIGAIVLSNLMYLVGAVAAMVLLSLVVVLRHRRPKSVEANVKTFHRGLAALAPEGSERRPSGGTVRVSGPTAPGSPPPGARHDAPVAVGSPQAPGGAGPRSEADAG
ncbi:MAG TPA: hypothetical protein VKU91_01795 [Acidimicrobiales bacterium]|nr:hypothetical protein [Acidimicrobiales bacterium]